VGAPGAEVRVAHGDPGALLEGGRAGGTQGQDLETAFVAADGGGKGGAEEGGEGRAGGVDALDLVDVRGVDGGGEGAEEEGGGGEGGGDGVVVEAVGRLAWGVIGELGQGGEEEREERADDCRARSRQGNSNSLKHILRLPIRAIHQRLRLGIPIWPGLVSSRRQLHDLGGGEGA
jgi:hypothetical protein